MSSIEAWEIVGRDCVWFLRWPVVCGLWFWAGYTTQNWEKWRWKIESSMYPPILALVFTTFVANY